MTPQEYSPRTRQELHLRPPRRENSLSRPDNTGLPMYEHSQKFREAVQGGNEVILIGATGSGKSTYGPVVAWETIAPLGGDFIVTQPRQLAALSVGERVASQFGSYLGRLVGVRFRGHDKTSKQTRIFFTTDGSLNQQIRQDPLLGSVSGVFIDEAHETDTEKVLTLAQIKRVQRARRTAGLPPLKLIVASATIDEAKIQAYFTDARTVKVPGRTHSVIPFYEPAGDDYVNAAGKKAAWIWNNQPDNIKTLIFMPGKAEIYETINLLKAEGIPEDKIYPLHAELSAYEQRKVFEREGEKAIIVATNVAETSITVPKTTDVIDTGWLRQKMVDPVTGIESLETVRHARAGCDQRMGRAGRDISGRCYRLYSEDDYHSRPEFQLSEMRRANMAGVVLRMKDLGISDIHNFDFIDKPEPQSIDRAIQSLRTLGALDSEGNITPTGKLMAELGMDPHLSRMMVESIKNNCTEEVAAIAAFAESKPPFIRKEETKTQSDAAARSFAVEGSDFLTMLNIFQQYQQYKNDRAWVEGKFINRRAMEEIVKNRDRIIHTLRENQQPIVTTTNAADIERSVVAGFLDNLIIRGQNGTFRFLHSHGPPLSIDRSSALTGTSQQVLVAASVMRHGADERSVAYAQRCQRVELSWLKSISPELVTERNESPRYDYQTDQVASRRWIELKNHPAIRTEPQIIQIAGGEQAVDIFASTLARGGLNIPVVFTNRLVVNAINEAHRKKYGYAVRPRITHADLKQWYKNRLGTVASRRELEQALEAGTLDLMIKAEDYPVPAPTRPSPQPPLQRPRLADRILGIFRS